MLCMKGLIVAVFIMTLYYKMQQQILLQNVATVFLQNVTKVYRTMCQVFHYDSFITKFGSYYKMRRFY